jgi:hypothetical protein
MTLHEMMWHTRMLRELKLMTCIDPLSIRDIPSVGTTKLLASGYTPGEPLIDTSLKYHYVS